MAGYGVKLFRACKTSNNCESEMISLLVLSTASLEPLTTKKELAS